ncbi:leukemia inhibitory factor receptor-like isoform X2 [Sardina pilchardus]|uniref:leukemia inhibitory factor receptor-like isoform X2 n=1 Tax=Sardina pilchardus TaxID=27697 RepID=UPI002E15EBEB
MIICLLLSSFLIQAAEGLVNQSLFTRQSVIPQLQDVRGNIMTNGIDVSWTDEASFVDKQEKNIYDIEIYAEQAEPVHRGSIERSLDILHHWHWTSPLPLQCLRHAVRLRYHNASEWTDLKYVTGSDPDYSLFRKGTPVIYPRDDTDITFLAGSRKTFCCLAPNGTTLEYFPYQNQKMKSIRVGQTYFVDLVLNATGIAGDYLLCGVDNGQNTGSVVYVGYSPEVHNFTCETRNLRDLNCSWTQGRDKNLKGLRRTKYILNEGVRPCETQFQSSDQKFCFSEISPNQGETAWILTAENKINKTSFTYTVDPRHRVYLPSPQHLKASHVNSRNASIQWHWPDANLMLLSMQCQVQITWPNKTEDVREDTGVGLISMTLRDLHPYTNYSIKVRCASNKHFWKWGDWAEIITFQTKEDIPQAVDVWMTVDNNNRSLVVWKKLETEQSHGEVMSYELSWSDLHKTLNPTQHCYNMDTMNTTITIKALNNVGYSQPSTITIPSQTGDVETTRVNGSNGGVELTWDSTPGASCGYVVDWYPVGSQDKCDIQWIKIPAGQTNATINSGLKDGVRYTFSLYSCTSNAPKLLQRWEGYGQELAPDKEPVNFQGKQDGMDVVLTWEEIPLKHRRGFIQRYEIEYSPSSQGPYKTVPVLVGENGMQTRIPQLSAETYKFSIYPFTSGGKGSKPAITAVELTSQISQIIVYSIVSLAGAITLFLLFTCLCYQKRAWLKDKVYPDIPAPQIQWLDAKGFHDCKLAELPAEPVEYLVASPIPVSHNVLLPLYKNVTDSQLSDCKFHSSTDIPISEMDNPTYNLLVSVREAEKAAPVTTAVVTTLGYKPQLSVESSELPLCLASSYQALDDACGGQQLTACNTQLESEDYISVGLVGSPTSVNSSQPLLGDSFQFGQHA